MINKKVLDGNEACALASYNFTEVSSIYPITPSSRMASLVDKWSSMGKRNILGEKVSVVEMQSEAGASAFMHGSLQGGRLTTTYTASQGLLLMIPSMYKIAGESLPGVIHVAARSLSTHALSIFGDHQDIYAVRPTGFCMLSSSSVEDAYYLSLVSHLSSLMSSLPFLHFFDGFRTSHEINTIDILEEDEIKSLIDIKYINDFRNKALNIGKSITRGTSETEDVYFQNTEARNTLYLNVPSIVEEYMNKINKLTGKDYKPFNYYGSKNAKYVIIAMGSVCSTIKLVIDELNKEEDIYGLINVHLYRPFSIEHFLKALPKTVQRITALDRTKEAGTICEPLYLDICAALKGEGIEIVGGRFGLSSKDTTPSMIYSVFENMKKHSMKDHFTLGIIDDVTNTNLPIKEFNITNNYKEIKVFGFGSDGMVSASKNILKVMSEKYYVQGYFEYDSKKSGGVTISHLRLSENKIDAPFYLEHPSLVVVTKDEYLSKYEILTGIKKNGILLINSNKTDEELNKIMKNSAKETIKNMNIRVLVSNAEDLSEKYNLKGKINNIVSIYMLKMLGINGEGIVKFKENIKEIYKAKEEKIVENNIKALDEALDYLRDLDVDKLENLKENIYKNNIYNEMLFRRGNLLKVSDFLGYKDGTFEGGVSSSDKRKISTKVPSWCKENCIECNLCAFICPHAVIKPFNITDEELEKSPIRVDDTIPSENNKHFYLGINTDNCTGCTLCTKVCPGKNGEKALTMTNIKTNTDEVCDYLKENIKNETSLPRNTVKGLGFLKNNFEFPGACAGCGETVYLKILTSLYGDEIVISNATGCSSIYGASLPCTPYKVPWISSLFEDNAEFGLGLHYSYLTARERIKEIMVSTKDDVSKNVKDIYKKWIDNMDDYTITNEVKNELINSNIPEELKVLIDYIPSRKVWIVGGDGWAYDIGFGGLDHVLRSNENIKVLVLDTEVYSNTGGQTSKSTKLGAVAEFSSKGKLKPKKDLFNIAMNIPNCYVASISAGASPAGAIGAFKEASEHNGPSVIIAYSPCIAHGIIGGLSNSVEEQKLLVESGYNILMRYNPENKKLYIDSKEPNYSLYETVFAKEMRYKNLENINKENYEYLYKEHVKLAEERYNYYLEISKKTSEN